MAKCLLTLLCTVFLLSCSDSQTEGQTERTYSSHVNVEKLTEHITTDKGEQKIITDFLYGMEGAFHIDPHLLFQENDYLLVIFNRYSNYVGSKGTKLSFIFSAQEPRLNIFNNPREENMIYLNGYLEYSLDSHEHETHYESWYESPSKYASWKSGFRLDYYLTNGWYKIVNLNEFDWYRERKQP